MYLIVFDSWWMMGYNLLNEYKTLLKRISWEYWVVISEFNSDNEHKFFT